MYLIYLIRRIIITIKSIKRDNKQTDDDFTNIVLFLLKYFRVEKVARLLSFELGAVYYCFFKWKKLPSTNLEYSSYKTNATSYQLYFVILFMSIVEAIIFQLFLHKKYPIISLIFIFIHIYFFITIIGHLKATYYRRNILLKDKLIIRYGLFEACEINLENIETICTDNSTYDKRDKNTIKYGLLGQLETHNTLIVLKHPMKLFLPFGKSKSPKRVLFFVDDYKNLIQKIESENFNTLSVSCNN